jgi:hypothetical protein
MGGDKLGDLPLESSRDQLNKFEDSQWDSSSSLPRLEQSMVCSSCDDDSSLSLWEFDVITAAVATFDAMP